MLARRVLPGAALVRAIVRCASALIRLDLPTLDRPASATCGRPSCGIPVPADATLVTKSAAKTFNSPRCSLSVARCAVAVGRCSRNPYSSHEQRETSHEKRATSVGNALFRDGRLYGFGFGRRSGNRPQGPGQRNLQDLIHVLDEIDIERIQNVLRVIGRG